MITALVHPPGDALARCELTFVDRKPIDLPRARQQHAAYCALLARLGVTVRSVTVSPDLPDAVFVEDPAVALDEVVVLATMGALPRRAEVDRLRPVLAALRPIDSTRPPGRLEGGDVLRVGRTLFVGQSPRTDAAGTAELARIAEPLGYRVVPVAVRGCLHLKTACTALADDLLLAHGGWVDLTPFAGMRVVPVDTAEPFAGNVLRLPQALLASASHPRTNAAVQALGLPLCTVQIDELEKAEAGVTCLSLLLDDPHTVSEIGL